MFRVRYDLFSISGTIRRSRLVAARNKEEATEIFLNSISSHIHPSRVDIIEVRLETNNLIYAC